MYSWYDLRVDCCSEMVRFVGEARAVFIIVSISRSASHPQVRISK